MICLDLGNLKRGFTEALEIGKRYTKCSNVYNYYEIGTNMLATTNKNNNGITITKFGKKLSA